MMVYRYIGLLFPLLLLVQSFPINQESLPLDCEDVFMNGSRHDGVYTIYPFGKEKPLEVYCDMGCNENESHEGGQWTVIQRRFDGMVNFFRNYEQYMNYFGVKDGEYWLGLRNIHLLTWGGRYALQVDMEDYEGGRASALYNYFHVESENSGFVLRFSDFKNLGAGNALASHNGAMFSTYDNDQDGNSWSYCAWPNTRGGFWFNSYSNCLTANTNGLYRLEGNHHSGLEGIYWSTWSPASLKSITMKIKRRPVAELIAE
ncbi:hypothetical protein ACEWY4_017955 [Coilia grayii]|uniref:Fibrinogen C-terminal domain-containing protein n=1 Tax=Coilia grayii TaxID=363190 RepID=A0ABD1JJI8_9TELE